MINNIAVLTYATSMRYFLDTIREENEPVKRLSRSVNIHLERALENEKETVSRVPAMDHNFPEQKDLTMCSYKHKRPVQGEDYEKGQIVNIVIEGPISS